MQGMQPQSAAMRTPEELFGRFLWHACRAYVVPTAEVKSHILPFGSVCRYWTRLARRCLFKIITLRTHDDVVRFSEMLGTPPLPGLEPISDLVFRLHATPDNTDEPWLHLLLFSTIPKLQGMQYFFVDLLSSCKIPWRSLHPSVPRSLPPPRMPLYELSIRGAHFANGRALSRLLSSIPTMLVLNVSTLTFDAKPTAVDFITPPLHLGITVVISDDLQLCLAFTPLLIANASPRRSIGTRSYKGPAPSDIVDDDDLTRLYELCSIFDKAPYFMITDYKEGETRCTLSNVACSSPC